MDLTSLVDAAIPGPGSRLDRVSSASQRFLAALAGSPRGHPVATILHGNAWLGHPLHPVVIVLPIGAWCVAGWYDFRSTVTGDGAYDRAADGAVKVGVTGALIAAASGLAQYLDTRNGVRRETAVHAALNTIALVVYLGSWSARARGRRSLGKKLSALGLGVVMVSGYLGGDISYRHGVGVRPQVLRAPGRPASETESQSLDTADARHV